LADNDAREPETVKATLEVINQMQADGVIGEYAIGGAVGATIYLEPAATLDVDIFVVLPTPAGKFLLSLSPIYDYLKDRGAAIQAEHIVIGEWPVQFLPPATDLEKEAVENALPTVIEDVETRVMSPEHLVAIALQTGRSKDYIRILQFVEHEAVDLAKLQNVLERHYLTGKWENFRHRYLEAKDE
jgi:hypothetical protein